VLLRVPTISEIEWRAAGSSDLYRVHLLLASNLSCGINPLLPDGRFILVLEVEAFSIS
jgi:hypothetical protein